MPYEDTHRYDPHSRPLQSVYEDSEEQGFVDDDDDDDDVLMSLTSLSALRRPKRQKLYVMTTITMTIIGSCIALALSLGKSREMLQAPTVNTTTTKTGLPLPPLSLEVTCAAVNLKMDSGYSDCLHLCAPAQCCSLISSSPFSCLDDNRQLCDIYRSSCQHLDHKEAADNSKLDTSVDAACSTSALTTKEGVDQCESLCQGFSCCFDGSSTCDVSSAWCREFGACALLKQVDEDGFDSHQQAKAAVDSACADLSNYEGQTKCSDICQPALCCFLPDLVLTKQCNVQCDHYEVCEVLYGPLQQIEASKKEEQAMSFSIPQQVELACAPAKLQTTPGVTGCMDICQHHLCCFQQDGGCLLSNPEECHLYSACRLLTEMTTPLSESPQQACSVAALASDGPAPCVQACSSHLCCFVDERFSSSCASQEVCSGIYAPCKVLAPTRLPKEDANLLERVETACTTGNVASTLGASECNSYCQQRECCVQDGAGNCALTDISYCRDVKKCEHLNDIKEQKEKEKNAPSVISKQLDKVCNAPDLTTLAGFHNCYDQCYYHLCCFTEDPLLNCRDEKEAECMEYSACSILVESAILDVGQDAITESCSTERVETKSGLKACHMNCAQHLCCFQDPSLPSSCTGIYGESQCSKYSPCSILVGETAHTIYNNKEDPYLEALINNYCTVENLKTNDGIMQCSDQCNKRSCCFEDDDDSCYDTDKAWCDEAVVCKNLDVAINDVVAGAPDDENTSGDEVALKGEDDDGAPGDAIALEGEDDDGAPGDEDYITSMQACSSLSVSLDGGNTCHSICDMLVCCGTGTCSDENIDRCSEFTVCTAKYPSKYSMKLYAQATTPVDSGMITSHIACAAASLIADAGLTCQKVCDGMMCCKEGTCDGTATAGTSFNCEKDFEPCSVAFPDTYS